MTDPMPRVTIGDGIKLRVLSLGADRLELVARGAWKKLTADERFWARIEETPTGCWEWTGAVSANGYAQIAVDKRQCGAHRWSYERFIGQISVGLTIDHLCRNRRCVNPAHLEAVTQAENTARGTSPPAEAKRRGTCKHGHPLTAIKHGRGQTRCRICDCAYARKAALAKRTHCPNGHPYSETAYINVAGRRRCSVCHPRKPL